jgi:hypothetical protein
LNLTFEAKAYIVNLFSNFDDLSKKKSIHDYASDFKEVKTSYTPALTQGEKFKKYQGKIKKNLEKKISKLKSPPIAWRAF